MRSSEVRAERGLPGPAVVFECVGAAGLIQNIVESAEMGTRIYCAGGWYTGDTLDITTATRQGVTIQFGGGPHPQDWYGTLDAIASGRLDPIPSVGKIIGLDEVPDALGLGAQVRRPATNHRPPERRRRMTEREDRQDISELLVRYATGIDRRDWPLFRTVFTDDCQLDYGEIGKWSGVDAVTEFMEQTHAMADTPAPLDQSGHCGPRRRGLSPHLRRRADNVRRQQRRRERVGFYDDEIVRTADGWRIARRRFTEVRVSTVG